MGDDARKFQVRLVGRDGRRRYDPASRERLVAACLEPGVSATRLAFGHGVNANLLRKWIKRAKQVSPVFAKSLTQLHLAIISAALLFTALLVLVLTAPAFWGAMLFAATFGMGSGLNSVVGGTLPLELFGHQGYGVLQGRGMSIRLIVAAAAPLAFASMMQDVSVEWALVAISALGIGATAALVGIIRLVKIKTVRPVGSKEPSPEQPRIIKETA